MIVFMPSRDDLGIAHLDPPLARLTLAARQPESAWQQRVVPGPEGRQQPLPCGSWPWRPRGAGSPSSNPSVSASVSTGMDLSALDQAPTVVLVDVEENLFPPQIRSVVATALHAKGKRVAEDGVSLRKLC